jgi:hypothetical protein
MLFRINKTELHYKPESAVTQRAGKKYLFVWGTILNFSIEIEYNHGIHSVVKLLNFFQFPLNDHRF